MRKISVFVISVEATIYLLLYNLHDCTFNGKLQREINQNFFFFFQKKSAWLPHTQFWAIIEGQPHSPDFNHCISTILAQKSPEAS